MSDEELDIDADVFDADWLRRRTWDLPTDVDGFLWAIGGRKNLAKFMTHPSAEAMPDDLRAALGV